MKRVKIRVTQDDIDNGSRKSYCDCPVARAVRRAFRAGSTGKPVIVRHEIIAVGGIDEQRTWFGTVPPQIDRFISRFDAGKTVKPFAATLSFK